MQIYVGNLDFHTTEGTITTLFKQFGKVSSVKIIIDRETGRSKGFGFIEMNSAAEGKQAIAALNGQEVDGRSIKVNEAQKKPASNNSRW